ncbi:MAG: toxin-antitoxin system YwqK family antitoxin [Bacteroidales bacterium]|jgi:antitoxin component YwqK of YwqJK toxin-antitoxin module|nr:toxin-antitoxin system YwqK family antitoxin [Bacteroidales bacterium]
MKLNTGFITLLLVVLLASSACQREKTEKYPNGNLKSVQNFKGKKQHGLNTWYYENGKKQLEAEYRGGVLNGRSTRWYQNGSKESVANYLNGLKNGQETIWTATGIKTEERTYKNDTLNGPYRLYHENGMLKIEGYYNMGMFDGNWGWFNEFGFKVGDAVFDKGKGIQRAFHLNGRRWREIPFEKNMRNGTEKEYDESGKLIREIIYRNDVEISRMEY